MRLAGFFGLTAPFVMILYKCAGAEKLEELCAKLDNCSDRDNIEFAKCELVYFKKALENLPVTQRSELYEEFTEEQQLASFSNGRAMNYAGDADVLLVKLKRNLMLFTAEELLGEKLNSFVDPGRFSTGSLRSSIAEAVDAFMVANPIRVGDARTAARKISRKFVDRRNHTEASLLQEFNRRLKEEFKIYTECPEIINVEGKEVQLPKEERKVLQYFLDTKDDIDKIVQLFSVSGVYSVEVFGMNFTDLVQRKPAYLMRLALRDLNPNEATSAQFLTKNRNDFLEQLLYFKTLFQENMASVDENKSFGLSLAEALAILSKGGKNTSDIQNMIYKKTICLENLDERTLTAVVDMNQYVGMFSASGLNDFFQVGLTADGWDTLIEHMNAIGVYGFNLYTAYLFQRFLANSTLNMLGKIGITKQRKEEFTYVISELEALIDTLKPIGGRVDEKLTHL